MAKGKVPPERSAASSGPCCTEESLLITHADVTSVVKGIGPAIAQPLTSMIAGTLLAATVLMACSIDTLYAAQQPRRNDDAPWHCDDGLARALLRIRPPTRAEEVLRPVRLQATCPDHRNASLRAWNVELNREVPVQRLPDESVILVPGMPLTPGKEAHLFLYLTARPSPLPPAAMADTTGTRVETSRYRALVDAEHGGLIRSLVLKDGDRLIETLGKGIRFWHGRQTRKSVEDSGRVQVRRVAVGPVATVLQVAYPSFPVDGCKMAATYTFYADFIDVDFDVRVLRAVQVEWFKLPVNLRGVGATPGLYSNTQMQDRPLMTAGPKDRWFPDNLWHDVSYLGDAPYGLGVIARETRGNLYFTDYVQPTQNEWVYAEPYNYQKSTRVDADFAIRLRIVPHRAGKGQWRETMRKLPADENVLVTNWQLRDGPPIDTDADGLTDLQELQSALNPATADTDLDGVPDGSDPEPLRGPVPAKELYQPRFTAADTDRPQTKAGVKPVRGTPTLVIDERPYGPMCLTRCAASYEQLSDFGDRNFPVHFEMVGPIGWPGEQEKVFERLDQRIHRFLDEIPNARIILRCYVCKVPSRFLKEHPDEVLRFEDGRTDHFTKWYAMSDRPPAERGYASFASKTWRRQTCEALYRYVTHVRRSDYARSIIGYFVCGGGTEEWYLWGDFDHHRHALDFSPAMLGAFRHYLRRKYDGDVNKLRAAWADPAADFATAMPPEQEDRWATGWGLFYDPATQQRTRDYYYVYSKAREDSMVMFAKATKQACGGQQVVGMFCGGLQNNWFLEGAQDTLDDLFQTPDLDFWSSPPQYNRRGQGEHGCNRSLNASVRAHGKLWVSESDIRTCYSDPAPKNPSLHGRTPDLPATLGTLTREFAHQLCDGSNGWWFPMGQEWYNHEPIMDLFARFQRVGQAAMDVDRRVETDIAAAVDLQSIRTGYAWPVTSSLLDAMKVQELCRLGTPVDFCLLDDLLSGHIDASRYRMIILLNAFALTDAKRQSIDQRLRRQGMTLVWMFAPGLFNSDRSPELSLEHVGELLGYNLQTERIERRTDTQFRYTMSLTKAGVARFPGFDANRQFGDFERPEWKTDPKSGATIQVVPEPRTYRQRFWAVDVDDSQVMARFVDGGNPSIVRHDTSRTVEYWIGSVMAPADLLRSIARQAGCHLYCDADEIIYANRSFLAIHAGTPGQRTFRLRRPVDVLDAFTGEVLVHNGTEFTQDIDAFVTRLFYLGSAQQWAKALAEADAFHRAFQVERQRLRKARAANR